MEGQHKNSALRKKRILVLCDFYLPSTKSGGGMWTIVNLVDRFSSKYDFFIVARNHESRNDLAPFRSVKTGEWNDTGNAQVYYLPGSSFRPRKIADLIGEIGPTGVFLNSVFSRPSIAFLLARKFKYFSHIPVVAATCGELSPLVLRLKWWKKKPYLLAAKLFGLYRGIWWKASSASESEEIQNALSTEQEPMVAPDLAPREILPGFTTSDKPPKMPGQLKIIFYSRIVPKKNLSFLLERLLDIADGRVELTIAGPIEDESYWTECQSLMRRLPSNVTVNTLNAVSYNDGLKLLQDSHLFVLPTIYENFGYVVLEALGAGCPVLISDRTIWSELIDESLGWTLPLDRPQEWIKVIEEVLSQGESEFHTMSAAAREFALNWLRRPENESATANVLETAFGGQ